MRCFNSYGFKEKVLHQSSSVSESYTEELSITYEPLLKAEVRVCHGVCDNRGCVGLE